MGPINRGSDRPIFEKGPIDRGSYRPMSDGSNFYASNAIIIGLSDPRSKGPSVYQTLGLKDLRSNGPSFYLTLGLSDPRSNGPSV